MSYENAPATILLATACACCGRPLVDAESVERGTGPDCAERFGVVDASGPANWAAAEQLLAGTGVALDSAESPRNAANKLVHFVARSVRSIDREHAQRAFSAIAALGYDVLANRIAKRFRAAVIEAGVLEAETKRLRAEYAKIRFDYCRENANGVTHEEFNAAVLAYGPKSPEEFVTFAGYVTCVCKSCNGSGEYRGVVDGPCYRCEGKGRQSAADVVRNRAYDALRGRRRAA